MTDRMDRESSTMRMLNDMAPFLRFFDRPSQHQRSARCNLEANGAIEIAPRVLTVCKDLVLPEYLTYGGDVLVPDSEHVFPVENRGAADNFYRHPPFSAPSPQEDLKGIAITVSANMANLIIALSPFREGPVGMEYRRPPASAWLYIRHAGSRGTGDQNILLPITDLQVRPTRLRLQKAIMGPFRSS